MNYANSGYILVQFGQNLVRIRSPLGHVAPVI